MKKLAIIGMVFAGLMLSSASAWAQPTGPTKAEYRALMLRSDGLNQKYSLGQYATGLTKAEYRALMLRSEGMNQKYGAYRYSKPPLDDLTASATDSNPWGRAISTPETKLG